MWRVIGALADAPKKSGSGYEARCPAHEDAHASLSIGVGLDGRVLLKCHAGCPPEAILTALQLEWSDLFEKSAGGNPVRRFRLIDSGGRTVATHVREDLPGEKKIWWEAHGKLGLNGTPLESLPLYRLPDVLAADPATPVIVCEGEKAADALADKGLLAVGTVTGAGATPSDKALAPLIGREVWLWPDNDQAGQEHMQRIAARLHPTPRWIKWSAAPEKGDAADYVAGGGTADGIGAMLEAVVVISSNKNDWTFNATELEAELPEPRWAVPGILPEGVVLLAGKSKLGKSWLALDLAIAVTTGRQAWANRQVEEGDVLYLALEDSKRRLQDRMFALCGRRLPARLDFMIRTHRANEGGLEQILEWVEGHSDARLVIVDVLGKFRPKESKANRLYDLDYEAIAPLADIARVRGICILVLHHCNKMNPEDPLDSVSGTTGLVGAADAIAIFRRERGKVDASLLITGRDVEEQELAFQFVLKEKIGTAWKELGDAEALRMSQDRKLVVEHVAADPWKLRVADLADLLNKDRGAVKALLFRMARDGEIRVDSGKYGPSVCVPTYPRNSRNHLDTTGTPVTVVTQGTQVTHSAMLTCRVCGNELPAYLKRIGLHYDCVEGMR